MILQLSLRGTVFHVRSETFEKYPDSLLGAALKAAETRDLSERDPHSGGYFFDRDPELFRRVVLSFYTYGFWPWLPTDSPGVIYEELCYWGLAPVAAPEPGDDLGDYPTFVGFALSTLETGTFAFTENPHARQPDAGKPFTRLAETVFAHTDRVRSVALRRGVWLDLNRLEGVPEKAGRHYTLQSYELSVPCLEFDGDRDFEETLSVVKLVEVDRPFRAVWKKEATFNTRFGVCKISATRFSHSGE